MLSFISFLLISVGCINWFSIGILQYDFVAGIFGSQSNIFSRIIYTLVGIASIVMIVMTIKNKGNFRITSKKENEEYESYMEDKKEERNARKSRLASATTEASDDYSLEGKKFSDDKTTLEREMDKRDDM